MSLFSSFSRYEHFAELSTPLVTQGGVLTPAQRRAAAQANLGLVGLTFVDGQIVADREPITSSGTGGTSTATMVKPVAKITTASITTAAAGTHVITVTKAGITATSTVLISRGGGSNTQEVFAVKAVCSTDTITITITNQHASSAFNGTIILYVLALI